MPTNAELPLATQKRADVALTHAAWREGDERA
jgi:hypothetical protein